MKRFNWVIIFLLSVVIVNGCQSGTDREKIKKQPAAMEDVFPEFTVQDFSGQENNLNKYRGKIVILDLFATWCPPCRMEIPHFVELQNEYKDNVAVVGLSYDQGNNDKVISFAKEMNINYDLYMGSQEIAKYVGLRGIPHTLVIDQKGTVVNSFVGYRDKSVFEDEIKKLLNN